MIVLHCAAWVALTFLTLFVLIMLISVKYDLRGCQQEKISGDLKIRVTLFQLLFKWSTDGNNIFSLRLAGITLWKSPLGKKTGMNKKKLSSAKKAQASNWRDIFDFMEKDFIKVLLRAVGNILRHSAPQTLKLKGVWGFSDPYYTGILAAVKTIIPGIQVEPDFTREVRDLEVLIRGRIRPVFLLYYSLQFLVSRQTRPVLKKLWQKRKIKNYATTLKGSVY